MINIVTANSRQAAEIRLTEECCENETKINIRRYRNRIDAAWQIYLNETEAIKGRCKDRITAARLNYDAEVKEKQANNINGDRTLHP